MLLREIIIIDGGNMRNGLSKKKSFVLLIAVLVLFIILNNLQLINIFKITDNFYVSYDEIAEVNENKIFGQMVDVKLQENEVKTGQEKSNEAEVVFKLFGFIPVKKVKVKLLPEEEVYVGGVPVGLTMQTEGAVVVSDTIVDAQTATVTKNKFFKNGDLIKEINGVKIENLDDIDVALQNCKERVNVKYQRNNNDKSIDVELIKDKSGNNKLGLWVRDDVSGVGTLTFVKKENGQFGALGHAVTNNQNENILPVIEGELYSCNLVNIEKGEKNNPGELRCVFVQKNKQGKIIKNTKVGIYGVLDENENLVDQNRLAKLGGRLSVKPGKAKIISSVSGIIEEYDIEIVKANFQSKCDDKSFVIKVVDKRLLQLTGGIVQGMSGSPIMQNGKIVGAVTHVFVSDPTKGYGVYSDWMLEQLAS